MYEITLYISAMYYDWTYENTITQKKVTVTGMSQHKAEMDAKFQLKCEKVKLVYKKINLLKTARGF